MHTMNVIKKYIKQDTPDTSNINYSNSIIFQISHVKDISYWRKITTLSTDNNEAYSCSNKRVCKMKTYCFSSQVNNSSYQQMKMWARMQKVWPHEYIGNMRQLTTHTLAVHLRINITRYTSLETVSGNSTCLPEQRSIFKLYYSWW